MGSFGSKRLMYRLLLLVFGLVLLAESAEETSFTAAVFEYARFGHVTDHRDKIVGANLDFFDRAAALAKNKGVDILVYPEYGLFPPNPNRDVMKTFGEEVPENDGSHPSPCDRPKEYEDDRPILYYLSCIAKKYSVVIVTNLADIQNCTGQAACPADGVFLFNANVVFDRAGRILLKYHKENLFNEPSMNPALKPQFPIFKTDFGKFSTFAGFDIQFQRTGQVSKKFEVDAVTFPAMLNDQPPQMTSLQVFESWAVEHNLTLLAADVNSPEIASVGSGIFRSRLGESVYTYNPDGISKLLVAKISKGGGPLKTSITALDAQSSYPWKYDGLNVAKECSRNYPGNPKGLYKDFRCFKENMSQYTFVKLSDPSGVVKSCNNLTCCTLNYETEGLHETFYLGSFSGIQRSYGSSPWCEETCVLTICESNDDNVCVRFPRRSYTKFRLIEIKGTLTTQDIYPSIVESGMRLVPKDEWNHRNCQQGSGFSECFTFQNGRGRNVLAAGFKGRCYDKDPPRLSGKS